MLMKTNPKNQQAEKIISVNGGTCYKCGEKNVNAVGSNIHKCQPSEEKDTLPKIKPKKIDIKKLEGIVERYNSEEKEHTEAGWEEMEETWEDTLKHKIIHEKSCSYRLAEEPNDCDCKVAKNVVFFIAQVIKEEREKLKQLILERMPDTTRSHKIYKLAISDVTKVINNLFDGRE